MDAGDGAAWQALLPADPAWLPPRSSVGGLGLRRQLSVLPAGTVAAVAGRGGPLGAPRRLQRRCRRRVRSYLALPSWRRPVMVADRDPVVLRYVGESLLTVPPGAGPLVSLACTVGLRLLRLRGGWALARSILPGRVTVGRLA